MSTSLTIPLSFPAYGSRERARSASRLAQTSDLWLQNKAGVVMHLTGTQTGVTLSLGKDELYIRLGQPN